MYRFFLTVVLVAALAVAAGLWWDLRTREMRRREQGEIALRVERELERTVTLEGYAGKPEIREVLRHLARQVDLPIFVHRDLLDGKTAQAREEIHLPPVRLSLRSMIGMLSRQGSFGYLIDGPRLVITTEQHAGNRLETKVYPLPQVAGPEQPFGADQDTWIEVLSVVIEPDSWDNVGGPGEIVPVPGALIIRQTHRAHERLRQFFDKLHKDLPTPDAQGDYLSSYSPEERRIHATLDETCDFECEAMPLQRVLEELGKKQRIPIVLNWHQFEEHAIDPDSLVTLQMKGVSLRSVLKSVLEHSSLTYQIRYDLLMITTEEDVSDHVMAVLYDVRDLVIGNDFDSLIELITITIDPDSWPARSGPGPLQEMLPGWLAFTQTDEIHEKTAKLLTQIRSVHRARTNGMPAPNSQSSAEKKLAAALEQNFQLTCRERPLREVVADLAKKTGVNVRLDELRLEEARVNLSVPVTCDLPPLPLQAALGRLAQSQALAEYVLAWSVRDESLVLTTMLDANTEHEQIVIDVHDLVEPREDENAFQAVALENLVESVVRPRNWNGAANVATFRSLLVCSAPRHVNEQIQRLVAGIRKYREQSLLAKRKGTLQAPLTVAEGEPAFTNLLRVKIYPADDLLGDEGPAQLTELKAAILATVADKWREASEPGSLWIGEVIPVPPAGLLAAHSQPGHDELQMFLDELRQHFFPGQPIPVWLAARDERRKELEQALSSRESVLAGVIRMKQLRSAVERAIKRDVALGVLYLVREFEKIPDNAAEPRPVGSEPPTVKEQLAGLGLAVVDTEYGLKLLDVTDDIRLAFIDARKLLAEENPFDEEEICALLDSPFPPEIRYHTVSTAPSCFRGWVFVRSFEQRLRQLAEMVRWLEDQPAAPRALAVRERGDAKETDRLIRQLLVSKSAAEQLYLAFVLQFAAPPENALEELAVRFESQASRKDQLLTIRLTESLSRWISVLPNEQLEAALKHSRSRLVRLGAVQTLSSRLYLREPTGEVLKVSTEKLIAARAELSSAEVAELRLALEKRSSPSVNRSEFELKDRSDVSPLLRHAKPALPPWRGLRGRGRFDYDQNDPFM